MARATPTPTGSATPTGTHADRTASPTATPTASPTPTPTVPPASGSPSKLKVTGSTPSTITIGWSGKAGTSYDVLRSGIKIATVTSLTFTDIGLQPNTPYLYSIRGNGVTTPVLTATAGTSTSHADADAHRGNEHGPAGPRRCTRRAARHRQHAEHDHHRVVRHGRDQL